MQSMPLLLRQSFRSRSNLTKTNRSIWTPLVPPAGAKAFTGKEPSWRNFSVCLQCQFRTQHTSLLSDGITKPTDAKTEQKPKDAEPVIHLPGGTQTLETNAGSDHQSPHAAETAPKPEGEGKEQIDSNRTEKGGLPSYIENRRSQFSKQFTTMMDNLQSNVFVAGQRLNDLTGYSSIEALKKDIHGQEAGLRAARLQVRTAKDAYAAAINRRSASQREVNELLQRKHAWSPADLERFTHLYRNDHTNEVAENEAQEALSSAERESEEAAAQLMKKILSRYHEEQVWSDKIRRMSTWGTWGLMGMNVLLFLIFQIGVEPWRRKRLVKGFEDKVIEAIEKEKATNHAQLLAAVGSASAAQETTANTTPAPESSSTANPVGETASTDFVTAAATDAIPVETASAVESYKPPPLQFPPSGTNVESWRQYLHDLFSERSVVVTQRDLSTVALTSAAAGAAVTGLILALIRPR